MSLTAREEIVMELYRLLGMEQRNDLVRKMRALVDANRITQAKMKVPINVVGNGRIEAKYGLPTPSAAPARGASLRTKPKPRRPDRAQDDNET